MVRKNKENVSIEKVKSENREHESVSDSFLDITLISPEMIENLANEGKTQIIKDLVEIERQNRRAERLDEFDFLSRQIQIEKEREELQSVKIENEKAQAENNTLTINNMALRQKLETEIELLPKEFRYRWILTFVMLLFAIGLAVSGVIYVNIGTAIFLFVTVIIIICGIFFVIIKDSVALENFRKIAEKALEVFAKIK